MKSQTQIGQLKEAMVIDQNARTKANNVKHLSGSKFVGKISVKSDPIDALDYLAEQSRNGNILPSYVIASLGAVGDGVEFLKAFNAINSNMNNRSTLIRLKLLFRSSKIY
ncbi:MAG: hypothetical protein HRT72_06265 [Flavobacteriales bacterium]|nr:hypothetical protein [Flavobacteriales bacterium]